MTQAKTIIDQYDEMIAELRATLFSVASPSAVDWSKLKGLLGQFLQAFGPIIMQLLVSMLIPVTSE
jgi:hypothetical protein